MDSDASMRSADFDAPTATLRTNDPLVSLVVPCYKESEAIDLFMPAIAEALPGVNLEFVFINDGSPDDTLDKLKAIAAADARVKVVNLSRNFGKEAAMTAGIDYAAGDVVVPMDADLQDPPELILEFLEKWREGYDVVYGVRVDRSADTRKKRASASAFYNVFNRIADVKIPANAGDFRLIDRRVIEALKRMPERNRFMKGLFAWVGYPSIGVPYVRPARSAGTTKFNYWKLWNFALDGVVSFSSVPLRVWTYFGALFAAASIAFGAYLIIETLVNGRDVPGWTSIMVSVLFLGGVQLITLGVLGEYIARLFTEVKGRPIYLVENVYGASGSQ